MSLTACQFIAVCPTAGGWFCSPAITFSLQLLLLDDNIKQKVACLDEYCLFCMHKAEQLLYQILIDNSQQGSKGGMWVHLVIATGLVAKQEMVASKDAAQNATEQVGTEQKRRPGQ